MNSHLLFLLGSFFLFIAIRVPVAFALGLSSLLTVIQLGLPFTSIVNQMFSGINSFPLLAVPFFLLLGRLMNDGGITDRLMKVSDAWVGHIKGGLGHVNVMVSMLFAGLSGSSSADTAGIGAMLIPAMKKAGFDVDFSVAITAASSTLGGIIPPSILMVVYGAMGQLSIGALFLTGIVPGILIGIAQMLYSYCLARKRNYPSLERKGYLERLKVTASALPPLSLPFVILGGVTFGYFTATEAAAIAVLLGLILILIVYRHIGIKDLPAVFADSLIGYAVPMFAVANASIFGWLIAYLNAPATVANWILSLTHSYYGVYAMIVLFLLIVGTFLSPLTAVIIFLPILQKMGDSVGIHPLHLGVIVNLTLSLGLITPPYGICLLIASQLGEISTPRAFLAIFPMIFLTIAVIVLGILFPGLFLFIPRFFMPASF